MSKSARKIASVVTNVDPFGIIPDKIENKVAPIVLSAINPAVGAAYTAGKGYADTGNIGGSLAKAAGSYLGGKFAGNILGDLGTVGGVTDKILGAGAAESVGNIVPSTIANAVLQSPINSIVGSAVGGELASSLVPQKTKNPTGQNPSNSFSPTRAGEKEAPLSLRGSGALSPEQFSSSVATQGVYGGGAGPEEQDYFLSLINRRLVDDAGKVDTDLSEISPIENSYLSQLGFGGMGNPMDLLEAISKRKPA